MGALFPLFLPYPFLTAAALPLPGLYRLTLQDEDHFEGNTVLNDLSVFDPRPLLRHANSRNTPQRLGSPQKTDIDRIFKALR